MSNPTTSQPFDQDASEETAPLSPQIGRMLVILGDTSDASGLLPLIKPSASTQTSAEGLSLASREDEESSQPTTSQTTHTVSLLIHEATDAYIPPDIDTRQTTGKNRSFEIVEAKATEKGHSTPGMAGVFAKLIGAQRLVLNHIGSRCAFFDILLSSAHTDTLISISTFRFPAPPPPSPYHHHSLKPLDKFRLACMREIERQALETWSPSPPDHTNHTHGANKVVVAWDYCRIVVPPNVQTIHPAVEGTTENVEEVYWDAQTVKETRHGGSDGTKRAWGHHHHSQQSYSRGFHTHARGERLGDTGGRGKVETAHGARDGSYKRGRGEGRSRDEHRSDKRQRH